MPGYSRYSIVVPMPVPLGVEAATGIVLGQRRLPAHVWLPHNLTCLLSGDRLVQKV